MASPAHTLELKIFTVNLSITSYRLTNLPACSLHLHLQILVKFLRCLDTVAPIVFEVGVKVPSLSSLIHTECLRRFSETNAWQCSVACDTWNIFGSLTLQTIEVSWCGRALQVERKFSRKSARIASSVDIPQSWRMQCKQSSPYFILSCHWCIQGGPKKPDLFERW